MNAGARVVRERPRLDDAANNLALRVGVANDATELVALIEDSMLLMRVESD